MKLRSLAAGLALAVLAAAPAWAAVATIPARVDLDISYQPPAGQAFEGLDLTGQAQFWRHNADGFVPEGSPIDIGSIRSGDGSVFRFEPPDPCIALGSCQLYFSFEGFAGQFPALALEPPTDPLAPSPPPIIPSPPPIIPLGVYIPGNPVHAFGPIYAWDAPVQVGTWTVDISAAPEPGEWVLMLVGFAGLGLVCRRRRGVLVQ